MFPSVGETFIVKVYSRKENSPYEYEKHPCLVFHARPASSLEKRNYRLQKGVNAGAESTYLFASRCNTALLKEGDKIEFMGEFKTIESIGFYIQDARFINASIFKNDYIARRSPKGITIK